MDYREKLIFVSLVFSLLAVKMESALQRQRDIVFFLWKDNLPGAKIVERLANVFGEEAIGKTTVYKWIERFKEGRCSTEDDPRSGRPCSSTMADKLNAVKDLILED
jgi:transposase